MKRILFVAEAVTLAQVVRLVTLARALPEDEYEIHFASARFEDFIFREQTHFRRHTLHSLTPEQVERSMAWGTRPYGKRILSRYVEEDLKLLDRVEPDLVVGDLRWSLLVSAPSSGVKHAALINAYWSPFVRRSGFPLPDHPIVKVLGERMAAEYFPRALPFVFDHFAQPLNSLRRAHGLPKLDGLLELLVAGDLTLYADVPELVPTEGLPASHHFLGVIPWAPAVPLPTWWNQLGERPIIYVTMGSSGNLRALPGWLAALAELPVDVCVATAGRVRLEGLPTNVHAAEYLPGDRVAKRARVVVCNGGSSTGYQALSEGRPVIGLPWNLDQYLAMTSIEAFGAGALLRSTSATPEQLVTRVREALDGRFDDAAARAQRAIAQVDSAEQFRERVRHSLDS